MGACQHRGWRYDSLVITLLKPNAQAGGMALRLLAVAAWLVALLPLRAEPISVGFDAAHIDLLPLARKVEDISPAATMDLPATGLAPAGTVALNARGPGRCTAGRCSPCTIRPRNRATWSSPRRTSASSPRGPVAAPRRQPRHRAGDRRGPRGCAAAEPRRRCLRPHAAAGRHGQTYALEVSMTGLDSLSLWHRGAFHVVADRYAFFRGLVLGISILLGIGFVCLFIVRPQSIFPAAALFGWSAIGFLVIETGYLPTVLARFPALAGSEQSLRALAEGLMLAGVIAMLASFLELRRWMPRVAMGLMAGGAAPWRWRSSACSIRESAIGLIRIAFALVVAGGLGVMLVLWRRGAARAQAALLGWLVLSGWTVAARPAPSASSSPR
jgi:hypothetical protein